MLTSFRLQLLVHQLIVAGPYFHLDRYPRRQVEHKHRARGSILFTNNHAINIQSKPTIHMSSILQTKTAGRHKPSTKQDKPLTYEEAWKPDMVGVRKAWNSVNTSTLAGGIRTPETAHEDVFIRTFVCGAWPQMVASEVIIRRRANIVTINFLAKRLVNPIRMYFLIGFTEGILSQLLKCVVKVEPQTIYDTTETHYKYI